MRLSTGTHTLAVLRLALGKTQKEMAALVGCSRPTIQAIELGKLVLSARLAEKIQTQTGVDAAWLARGNIKSPMVDCSGQEYDCGKFAETRFQEEFTPDKARLPGLLSTFRRFTVYLMSSMLAACEKNELPQWVFVVQTELGKIQKRFRGSQEFEKALEEVVVPQNSREKSDFTPLVDQFKKDLRLELRRRRRIRLETRTMRKAKSRGPQGTVKGPHADHLVSSRPLVSVEHKDYAQSKPS